MTTEERLLAGIFDRLSILVWAKTKDGQKNRNRPKLLLDLENEKVSDIISFNAGKDFEDERRKILEKMSKKGG